MQAYLVAASTPGTPFSAKTLSQLSTSKSAPRIRHTELVVASQAHVTDWLAAFAAHPRIGDLNQLKAKYSQFAKLSETEQASAATASGDVLQVRMRLLDPTASMELLVLRSC